MHARAVKTVIAAFALAASTAAGAPEPLVDPPAERAPLAARSLLLDVTRAGERLVAVGERGHVLRSDDAGRTWTQADTVPTSAMLTGVPFADGDRGWAVGHDEVILRTRDGGRTWEKTHYAPEAYQPLHDVWFAADGSRGIAIGAYGAYYTTSDGGVSWTARTFEPAPLAEERGARRPDAGSVDEAAIELAIGSDFHLNQIAAGGERLYIAAEAGRLFRSDDGGNAWSTLPSPYEGSFFGVLPLDGDAVLAFGLRGNLFRSEDAGRTWRALETETVAMLTDGVRLDARTVVIVGLSGVVLLSRDGGRTFELLQQDDRKGLAGAAAAGGALVVAGEGGVRRLALP